MFARGILFCFFLILGGFAPLHAATISIEKEPAELTTLRNGYESEKNTILQPIETRYKQDIATVEKLSTSRPELKKAIIDEYEQEKKKALAKTSAAYLGKLEALEKSLIQKRDLKGALLVQEEMKKIRSGATATASVATTAPAAPVAPAPAAPTLKPGPFVYKSNTEGIAGVPEFSKNNVYSFAMSEVRSNTKLTVYASGRGSTNTYGDIYLISANGQKVKIFDWSPTNFEESVKDVRSYKKLKPMEIMISGYFQKPGTYKISFEYSKGIDPLIIKYVELKTWQ